MFFVFSEGELDIAKPFGDERGEGDIAWLAERYPTAIFFEAALTGPQEILETGQCKVPLNWQDPLINICVLEKGHSGYHHTYGLRWNDIQYR